MLGSMHVFTAMFETAETEIAEILLYDQTEICGNFVILPARGMDGAPSGQADTCPLASG